ncbi:MAG: pseudouridine synthase [Patescibacteria group bacterium]
MTKMRLNKYLAGAGIASRRKADELIQEGKVKVNGKIITSLGIQIDPEKDKVEYQGKILQAATPLLFMFNKPAGVTSTMADPHAQKTVADYFKDVGRVYPVGRLDKDSEGLLLVTNDGDLANKLMHPRYEHEKEYEVVISRHAEFSSASPRKILPARPGKRVQDDGRGTEREDLITKFSQSFKIDGARIKPMRVKIINKISPNSWIISLILQEGRKRQIRRVAEMLGYKIIQLKRVRIGKLKLGHLSVGKYRRVLVDEII